MPFVEASAAPTKTTGGGGFRVAGASLIEQPPKWKPDVLAAVAPKRTVDWMGERGLPIVDQFTHDNGYRSDVISYPAPTEKDPNNRILLAPAAVPKRPGKRDEWLYGKDGYDAWLEKNGHRYRPNILEKDPATGKYRIIGTYQPATKRDTGETPPPAEDIPEVEAFARNRETLELLKGRNPEKFASAMKDYENYLAAKQRSPLMAIPLAKKAMEQFKEIMPEGGYDRWLSERKQVERGDLNPPLALNKAGSDQKPTAFLPSESRGELASNLGVPVEGLLQNEDAAARKKFQESQVSDSAMGRFGQSFATGVESVSSGLNRILNPFVSNETLDEVGRNRQAFRDAVQDKGGFAGDVMNKAADSSGTMAAGAAVGAVTGGTGTLMALAAGIAQYDDAYREASDAGLRGEQRTQYAMAQAGWEAGTSLVFTKALKIPGVEGAFARGAVGGKTFGEILKRVAVQSGVSGVEEIPEEVSTAIGQNLTAKLSGVDPERAIITGEELTDIITQSFVQSGMMTGARNAPDMARSLKPGQQQTAPGDQPAAAAGAAGPTPQQGPPALPILPPPSAATTDTTDFIPADLEGANNVNGLAQASPQVPWSNQIIRPQVLPAETNGNTAELPVARLAGETKGGGETPTPEPTKADPLRKLQPLPTTSDQAAVWAIENPELVKRVAEATKTGQPLTRAMMDSLGLKRGNAEQRAAFVKALFPEQTQGTTDASKTPSPAETQVLPPEPAAASTPEAVTVTTTHPAETVADKYSQESLRQSKIGGLRGRVKELMDSGMSREDAADQASRESREALESLDASLEDGDTVVIERVYEDDGSVASSEERVIEEGANGKVALKKDESGNVVEGDPRNFNHSSMGNILGDLRSGESGGRRTFARLRVKRRASDSRKATSPTPEAVTEPPAQAMPEGGAGFEFGGDQPAKTKQKPFGIQAVKEAFNLSDEQATGVDALAKAIGLDVDRIAVAVGGETGPGALDQAAYHGSPHAFDKFTTAAIGTGEGAQAFGWGLYFASKKEIAEHYRDILSAKPVMVKQKHEYDSLIDALDDRLDGADTELFDSLQDLSNQRNGYSASEAPAGSVIAWADGYHNREMYRQEPNGKWSVHIEREQPGKGRLYHVDLKPAEDEYLLWDKPLSEQSEKVRKALESAINDDRIFNSEDRGQARRYATGSQLYEQIAEKLAKPVSDSQSWTSFTNTLNDKIQDQRAASEHLKSLGIRGIKYLDGDSRSKGDGHFNYVIFDDADIEITNVLYQGRNGAVEFTKDGTAIIRGFESANVSTGVHEIAHVARRQLLNRSVAPENRAGVTDEDIAAAEQWAGVKDGEWSKEAEEKFARGFERYLTESAAPNPALKTLFAKLSDWLRSVYKSITGSPIDVHISRAMQTVFDRLVTRSERVKVDSPFTLKRESAGVTGPQKFDNAEGEQRRMFSGMDSLAGQEDLFDDLDKPAEAGQGFQSQDSAEASPKRPNPFRKKTPESSAKAQASTDTSAGQSARRPNPFGKVPRAKRANASEASTEASKRPNNANARPYGGGLEASAAGKLGPKVLKPLPMPELIQLAREILGKLPQIRKRMGAAFGRFKYLPGTRFMEILIRADLPQNEQDVAETLAHEIGHLIDYLPDLQMGRGNILGRIASLRNYMKEFMAGKEGGPGPLTADDEKRLREEAKKLSSTTAEVEIDEEIRQTMPITPADVLAVWNALDTSKLSPELITYIKRASAAEKKSIIRQAAKGIVADQLKQFATEVVTKTGKKIKQTTSKAASAADIKAKLEDLVAEEIRKRELLSRKTVTEELIAVSEWWRPYDKANAPKDHVKYRESSVELYADALSVLLNSPGDLQAMAPEFWRGFMEYIDKKPEFLNAFLELQSILAGDDATVAARRRENIQAMFDNGDQKILASLTAARAARMSIIETLKQFLGQYLLNSRQPVNTRVAKVKKAGGNVRVAENAEYIMDEFFRSDNPNHVFLTDVQAEVHKPLLDEGMSRDDLGEYLFLRRVLNERNEIANPLGYNATESAKQLADLEKRLGAKRFAVLEAAAKRFHELVYDVAAKATAAGYYSQATFDNTIRPNRNNYAAFAVVKYLEDHVTPAIKQQVGTFEEIANPFDATVMKVMAVNRMIELNNAKVAVRDLLLREFPQEVIPTPIPFKQREPAKPAPNGMEYVIVFEDGKPMAYAVPKEIATSFKSHDVGRLAHMGVVVQSIVYKIFHPLYVSLAPGFQAANPFKDLRRTLVNLPAAAKAKGVKVSMREILTEYIKAMPVSLRRARGIDDALLREMMKSKALDTPFAEMDLEDADKGQYQRLLEKHGIAEPEAKSRIGRAWQMFANLVEGVGVFQETITKVASYNLLKEKGLGAREAAHIVRKYVGTPDYKQRGLATAVTNSVWMYSKVKWNGLQADAHLATNPKTAAGWWWRALAMNVVPTWTYRAALAGAFGGAIAEMFQRIPKYFLDNYDCIPIGWVFAPGDEEEPDAGKVAFFTIPKDETGRLLSALGGSMYDVAQELMGSDSKSGSTHKALAEAGREMQAAVLPDMNPAFDIAWKWSQFGAGVNPVDHTGRQIVPRDEWTSGGWDASKMMLTWTSDKFGVISDLMKWAGRDNVLPSRFRGSSGAEENAPWYTTIPGLSRLMRTSDYGLREDEWTDIENDEQERARFRLGLGKEIRGATSERYALSRQDKFGLDDKRSLRLFQLNSWYAHTYLPLIDEIRDLEADGKDTADLRKKLDEDTATALMPEPDLTKPAERKKYLDVHGQSIGSTLMDATSPRPEKDKTESGTQFGERKERWTTRTADAKKLIELLDLTDEEMQQLLKDEAKRRGNGTKRWEGEYRNRRTDFGRREAKLKTLSP